MPRHREATKLKRCHIWLFEDDYDWFLNTYGARPGLAKTFRTVLHAFRVKVENKHQSVQDNFSPAEIEDQANEHELT